MTVLLKDIYTLIVLNIARMTTEGTICISLDGLTINASTIARRRGSNINIALIFVHIKGDL